MMEGNFLGEDYPEFHHCPFFLVGSLIRFPNLHVWDITLEFPLFNCMLPFIFCNSSWGGFSFFSSVRDSVVFLSI